eukprot:5236659-Amphidinium_carterae.1
MMGLTQLSSATSSTITSASSSIAVALGGSPILPGGQQPTVEELRPELHAKDAPSCKLTKCVRLDSNA